LKDKECLGQKKFEDPGLEGLLDENLNVEELALNVALNQSFLIVYSRKDSKRRQMGFI